jgi:CheY-like chemotaxis protein
MAEGIRNVTGYRVNEPLEKKALALVEDTGSVRVRNLLALQIGFGEKFSEIVPFSDATYALGAILSTPDEFSTIVSNFHMPEIDGLQFYMMLQHAQPSKYVQYSKMLTSANGQGLSARACAMGVSYFDKPQSAYEFVKEVGLHLPK